MKHRFFALALAAALILTGCARREQALSRTVYAMDTVMTLGVYGADEAALDAAERELLRLDALLDRHDESSAVSAFNASPADEPSALDGELLALLQKAMRLTAATDGAFDVTVAPLLDAWGFGGEAYRVPSQDELDALLPLVGSADGLTLTDTSAAHANGVRIDLGGVAKGYAGQRVREILRENGVTSASIDLGGDVCLLGTKTDGSAWRVAVRDPQNSDGFLGVLSLEDCFVVTSGAYERGFEENGVRYHHIIDPATGYPAESGLLSVSVVCADGAQADALSTAVFVMGAQRALSLWQNAEALGLAPFELLLVLNDGTVQLTGGLYDRFTPEEGVSYALVG